MAPLPKHKHSTMRRGKRTATRRALLPDLIICAACKQAKRSHRQCMHCKK